MIDVKPLAKARILVVGAGSLVNEITRNLSSWGARDITMMAASTAQGKMKTNPEFFKSFDLVLSADQPRDFELALSNLRWPKNGSVHDLDLPMMVMRCIGNNCKMRCQYRQLPVDDGTTSKFVSLPMDLPSWTHAKRRLVAMTVDTEFQPKENPQFQAYLTAALAVTKFQMSRGSWPTLEDREEVERIADEKGGTRSQTRHLVERMCEGGFAAVDETIMLQARLVTLDAIKLVTGCGQPINNTSLEEVFKIMAES